VEQLHDPCDHLYTEGREQRHAGQLGPERFSRRDGVYAVSLRSCTYRHRAAGWHGVNLLLSRATLLIVHLGRHRDGISLRALATESAVPPSTCVRLLRDLVALGWADQSGPRGGYRLGPRAASVAHDLPYRGRLVAVAQPVITALARQLGAQVLIAVLRGEQRLILLRAEGDGDPLCLAEERELYASASGRLLIAHLAWRARRRLTDRIGLPDPGRWPGVATWEELGAECAAIRRAGYVVNCPLGGDRNAIAMAIPDGEGGTAALAVGVYKRSWSEVVVMAAARRAAVLLTRRLASPPA
jgi:IclR family transcriptional regulator, KDG regulon repressor